MHADILEFVQSNRDQLHLITDLLPIPIFMKDRAGRYIDCNQAFKNLLAVTREQILDKTVYEIWSKEEADVFFAQDEDLFQSGALQVYESKITSSFGVTYVVQFHKQVFRNAQGEVAGLLGAIFDITEKKRLEDALEKLAATDELTGLPNRREGMERLTTLYKESRRKERPFCLAMMDIDHFKQLNDRYGHANGDLVLQAFAQRTQDSLRCGDTCFRYGGEEFVVLLPETSLEEGLSVVERLRSNWHAQEVALADASSVCTTVSIGITASTDTLSCEEQIQASDAALYQAKSSGRNCTVCSGAAL